MPFSAVCKQVQALAADGHAEAADLADRLGHAFEEIGVVVHYPAGTPAAAGFLVGQERDDDVARRPPALGQALPQHRQEHRIHVFHVDRAAAPDAVLGDLAGERVHPPVSRVGRNHVQMTVDEQGGPGRVCALDPGHDARSLLVRFQDRGLEPGLSEQGRDVLGRGSFARS